jgi:hypothetical protein
MTQAGARPLTVASYVSELQRDWGRTETADDVANLFAELGGGFGQGLRWEWQLLGLKGRHSLSPGARQGSRPLRLALARSTSSG